MSKYICKKCGEVEPKMIYYSFPAQFDCPICGLQGESDDKLKLLTEEEGRARRPEMYKKFDEDKAKWEAKWEATCNACKDKEQCLYDRTFTYKMDLPCCKAFKEELSIMKDTHMSLAKTYGSELCAEDMIRKEKELEKKIKETSYKDDSDDSE